MSEQLRLLETDNDRLQRELAGARSAAAALESRMQAAEVREARHLAEAREAEVLAAEHEELMAQVGSWHDSCMSLAGAAWCVKQQQHQQLHHPSTHTSLADVCWLPGAQVAALRDHLEESRAERGQLDHYRSISRELEGAKARVEEELLATAQLVTKLEARLREAHTKVGRMAGATCTPWCCLCTV